MQSLFWPIEHLDKNRQLTLRLCKFLCINLWADCKRSRNLHCNPLFRKVFVRIYSLGILSEEFNHIKTCLQFDWTITNYAAMTRHFRYVCRLSCNFTITNGWLKAHSAKLSWTFSLHLRRRHRLKQTTCCRIQHLVCSRAIHFGRELIAR